MADIKWRITKNYNQNITPFTKEGKKIIHKELHLDIRREISKLMKSSLHGYSVEYMDNRISRYSMKMGKCEITGVFLYAEDVHCHHYQPMKNGGSDKFSNLRILHRDVHRLIHSTNNKTIGELKTRLNLSPEMLKTVNLYRKKCNLELIDTLD